MNADSILISALKSTLEPKSKGHKGDPATLIAEALEKERYSKTVRASHDSEVGFVLQMWAQPTRNDLNKLWRKLNDETQKYFAFAKKQWRETPTEKPDKNVPQPIVVQQQEVKVKQEFTQKLLRKGSSYVRSLNEWGEQNLLQQGYKIEKDYGVRQ